MFYPLKFKPILKSVIWGGDAIIPFKNLDIQQDSVGESWELSGVSGDESVVANGDLEGSTITDLLQKNGEQLVGAKNYARFGNEFPLLIKFIDARDDLSIQVHPDDELALERHNSKGKTEMWYVVDATPEARLRSGFSRSVTPEEYVESVEKDTVTEILKEYSVLPGDLFFLPAGRIHSIGAGCFIAEIQQTSNITYRIYDFNRTDAEGNPRELHTEQAVDAIDYSVLDDYRTNYDRSTKNKDIDLISCPYFTTSMCDLTESKSFDFSDLDSFVILIAVEGSATLIDDNGSEVTLSQGETVLLPATTKSVKIDPKEGVKFLTTYIE